MPHLKCYFPVLRGGQCISRTSTCSRKPHLKHFRSAPQTSLQFQKWHISYHLNKLCGLAQQKRLATTVQKQFGSKTEQQPKQPKKVIQKHESLIDYFMKNDVIIEMSISKNQSRTKAEEDSYVTRAQREVLYMLPPRLQCRNKLFKTSSSSKRMRTSQEQSYAN